MKAVEASLVASVDLNCDMGESFGPYRIGSDAECLSFITSANVACGFHAGDAHTMRETVAMAIDAGVAVGAHPGLPDLQGFGRRAIAMSAEEVYEIVIYQVGALLGFCRAAGMGLSHVKPHGALSHMASADPDIATAICQATYDVDSELLFYAPAASPLTTAASNAGLRVVNEVYADRTYQDNGQLTPRKHPAALIDDVEQAIEQVLMMVKDGVVTSVSGATVAIDAESVCIHGDREHAPVFASRLQKSLLEHGVKVAPVRRS